MTSPALDTSAAAAQLVARLYAQAGGATRLEMACQMFDDAVQIVASSLPEGLSTQQRRHAIFRRFHGDLADDVYPL